MRFLAALAITVSVASCAPPTHWTDLDSIDELKDAFNADRGNVRVVLILSPT
jgi:hypothetical protein